MKLSALIVDDFLEDFARWRTWFDQAEYTSVVSDVDQVSYPGICKALPDELRGEILYKLQATAGLTKLNYLFARLSVRGAVPPHFAHHDASMGKWSCMLYMSRPEDCDGGTVMLEHDAYSDVPHDVWLQDTNNRGAWVEVSRCPMRSNRAFIFRAEQWHAALPYGGFGSTPQDGRLVVTAFFQ